ncbi:lysozyme [Methylobacterium mesophilicum]
MEQAADIAVALPAQDKAKRPARGKYRVAKAMPELCNRLTEDFAPAMERCARQPMGDDQYAAHLSLAYNIGTGAYCKSSVVRLWNQGDRRASCNAFLVWNKAGGRKIDGLTKRREAERALCLKGV